MDQTIQSDKDRLKMKFLTLLLDQVNENGNDLKEIRKRLNRSPQNLHYYLRKLRMAGLIRRRQSLPFAIYEVTDLGNRLKENLVQVEGARNFWRCHALMTGFRIDDFGSFDFGKYKKKHMNNWFYVEDRVKDCHGEWKILIQSTGLMKIVCPEKITEDPNSYFGAMYDISIRIARHFSESFSMKIGHMRVIREGHKELVGSEKLAGLFGKMKLEDIWVDNSTGSNRLEEKQTTEKIESLLDMPKRMNDLESHLVKQTEIMDQFARQMELHLSAVQSLKDGTNEMRDAVKEMRDVVKEMRDVVKEMRDVVKEGRK